MSPETLAELVESRDPRRFYQIGQERGHLVVGWDRWGIRDIDAVELGETDSQICEHVGLVAHVRPPAQDRRDSATCPSM